MAISTLPGRGSVGVVRISGSQAKAIALPLFRLRRPLAPGRVRFAEIVDEGGHVLDEAIVTYFQSPWSYTAEDVVEISCHGAPVLLDFLVRSALANGARLAEPGEFTQRAFLSGRLDLTQAEAVNDLIAAHTLQQARIAAAQLGGSLARQIAPAKANLISLIAELEAGIDFAEDDLDVMPHTSILAAIHRIKAEIQTLAATYRYGRIVRDGFTLAIVGRPNAGKSSLFNRLLERERAIVTAQPGTTRDPISERLAIGGIPVELIDTAGLRDAPDGEAEAQGIARTRTAMAEADFVVVVLDATQPEAPEDNAMIAALEGRPHQLVRNKCDLLSQHADSTAIWTSAVTGEGLEELKAAILQALTGTAPVADSALVTNLRQHEALAAAVADLQRSVVAGQLLIPHEMLLLDLHAALDALDRLTGATSTEEILGLIFSRFCIGK